MLAQWTQQHGPIFKWNLIGKTILVITDPVEVYKLCGREAQLDRARFMYKLLNAVSKFLGRAAAVDVLALTLGMDMVQREPHNSMLGTPDYEEWKYFRKTLNPGFSPDNIRKVSTTLLKL